MAVAVGSWLLGKAIVYLLQRTKGNWVALILRLVIAGFCGAMLTILGIDGLLMVPLFLGKMFAFCILLPGLWLSAVFLVLLLGAIFNQEGSSINQFLLKLVPILFNPTSLLPSVQPNPNLFKFSVNEPDRLEITPFWQLPALAVFVLLGFLGLGLIMCWTDYTTNSAQGIGLLVSAVFLPITGMGLHQLFQILIGKGSLIINKDGLVIPNSRKTYLWGEIQEFKIVNCNNNEFIAFQKRNAADEVIPVAFPISNQDLLEILKNRQAHCLSDVSLMDVTSFKGKRWFEHPIVIWVLIILPILALLYMVAILRLTNTPLY